MCIKFMFVRVSVCVCKRERERIPVALVTECMHTHVKRVHVCAHLEITSVCKCVL